MTTALADAASPRRSPFAGADVCRAAGLTLPDGTARPAFDDDLWDFADVIGLPNQMAKVSRRFDFAAVSRDDWRLVAKEQIMAMIAPRHEAVIIRPAGPAGLGRAGPAGHRVTSRIPAGPV